MTLEESIKETVLAQLAQIKTMNLLAQQQGVSLDEAELEKAGEAAGAYFSSLNEAEQEAMQVTEETIRQLYSELALANKVYEYIIKDINPEISDDEARSITIQDILIKTYSQDGTGKRIEYEESAREDAYRRAREILLLAEEEGNDFESLVVQYSEGEKSTYSFGKGEMEEAFENAAFNLETGEISGIVETEDGFHIIKCISTFNREETDANKIKIVEKRREEVFGQEYDAFVESLTRTLNEERWDSVAFLEGDEIVTKDFFDVYHQYFADFLERMDFDEIIDTTAELIAPYVEKDPTKFYTYEEFETGAAALKEFCRLRKESVEGQLFGSIPADSFGQAEDSSTLVDASHLNLSDMGTMEHGGEGFGRR